MIDPPSFSPAIICSRARLTSSDIPAFNADVVAHPELD